MNELEYLKRAFDKERLAHAYILCGNDENKVQESAQEFVRYINCAKRSENSCKECESCLAIDGNRFPDLYRVAPHGTEEESQWRAEIKIGQIRQLGMSLSRAAWNAPFQVAIVEQAHTMNVEAQSAFLKLLEEPRGPVLFLLLTKHEFVLLDTIRSRAQQLACWNFTARPEQARSLEEFQKLQQVSLHERFVVAKELAENPSRISVELEKWLYAARAALMNTLKEKADGSSLSKMLKTVLAIQEVSAILARTNSNARLALERLMIEF